MLKIYIKKLFIPNMGAKLEESMPLRLRITLPAELNLFLIGTFESQDADEARAPQTSHQEIAQESQNVKLRSYPREPEIRYGFSRTEIILKHMDPKPGTKESMNSVGITVKKILA